jgi:hypothetical protein
MVICGFFAVKALIASSLYAAWKVEPEPLSVADASLVLEPDEEPDELHAAASEHAAVAMAAARAARPQLVCGFIVLPLLPE